MKLNGTVFSIYPLRHKMAAILYNRDMFDGVLSFLNSKDVSKLLLLDKITKDYFWEYYRKLKAVIRLQRFWRFCAPMNTLQASLIRMMPETRLYILSVFTWKRRVHIVKYSYNEIALRFCERFNFRQFSIEPNNMEQVEQWMLEWDRRLANRQEKRRILIRRTWWKYIEGAQVFHRQNLDI